jgi:hypothetical protein
MRPASFIYPALVCLTTLALAGCRSAPPGGMPLSTSGESHLPVEDMVNVYLAPESASRVDQMIGPFGESPSFYKFATGPVWKRAFIGAPNALASVEIVSTSFRESLAGAGFAARFTYEANATLHFNGQEYSIAATGTEAAAISVMAAQRQAVEQAVDDAARQARRIMEVTAPR